MRKVIYSALTLGSPIFLSCVLFSHQVVAHSEDDPILTTVVIDQFENRSADDEDPWVVEGQAWIGKDLQKLWFKIDAERADNNTDEAELQALYSQGISTFWDLQVGLRRDFQPTPHRNWAVLGVQGLAPYFFEVDAALFIGDGGATAFRFEAEYEALFTQRLILSPDIAINVYAQGDEEIGIGSGLSDIEAGLRLRYEIRREFAPYVGINWTKQFGDTANYTRAQGKDDKDWQWVIGLRTWF